MTCVVASAHGLMVPLCQIRSGYCMAAARDSMEQVFCPITGGWAAWLERHAAAALVGAASAASRAAGQERAWGIGNRECRCDATLLFLATQPSWQNRNRSHYRSLFPISHSPFPAPEELAAEAAP